MAWILRKIHLVRPDLIPYPIFIETYCLISCGASSSHSC